MKRFLSFLLVFTLVFSLGISAFAATTVRSNQKLSVDGKDVTCDIYNIDGSNYFKLRDLAHVLNGTGSQFAVGYDNATRTVTVTTGAAYEPNGTELVIGEDKAASAVPSTQTILVDGVANASLSAYNIGGNNFFKLRELGDALGFDVDYDNATRTMLVNSRRVGAMELNAEQIYSKCIPAVFFIQVYDFYGDPLCTGSGFFIDSQGTAVTNFHVIYGGTYATVTVSDAAGKTSEYDVLGVYDWNQEEDWAILKIDGSGFSWLKTGAPSTAVGGATVYAIGSPLGFSDTLSQGLVSNPAREFDGQTYIQTTAAISPGSSGGALINKYGEVIGITSATFDAGQNLNLAIPMTKLSAIVKGEITPINETYVMPSGFIMAQDRNVQMGPDSVYANLITAIEYDCEEDVSVEFDIEDPDLIYCEWGDWSEDLTEIPLYIYSGDECGDTIIWVDFYTESGEILDSDYIYVSIEPGSMSFDLDSVSLKIGESTSMNINAFSYSGESVYLNAYPDDEGIVKLGFGKWNGYDIPMTFEAYGSGSTYVNIEMVSAATEEVLMTRYIYVFVTGGTVTVSESEVELKVGQTKTITLTGIPFDSSKQTHIACETYDMGVVDWKLGTPQGNSVTLSLTGTNPGWDCMIVYLLDSNDSILAYEWIDDIYVS